MHFEGALNLSHNSIFNEQRVLPPENLCHHGPSHSDWLCPLRSCRTGFGPTRSRRFPFRGTKNPSGRMTFANSASQTFVKFAERKLSRSAPAVKIFFPLFPDTGSSQSFAPQWSHTKAVTDFFSVSQRTRRDNIQDQKACKAFLVFPKKILGLLSDQKATGRNAQPVRRVRLFVSVWWASHVFKMQNLM